MKRTRFILSLLAALILASCSTGNMVTNGKGIQKRKYNDGYYVSFGHKPKKSPEKVVTGEAVQYAVESGVYDESVPTGNEQEAIASLSHLTEQVEEGIVLASETVTVETTNPVVNPEVITGSLSASESDKNVTEIVKPLRRYSPKMIYTRVSEQNAASADAMLIILVILALIIPPLAVIIYEGATSRFWIDLLLAVIGIGVGWWLLGPGIGWLCGLAAVIYALLIVLAVI